MFGVLRCLVGLCLGAEDCLLLIKYVVFCFVGRWVLHGFVV